MLSKCADARDARRLRRGLQDRGSLDLETRPESELSQKEKKQTSYVNTHVWSPGKRYRWTCLQSRNRDTDTEDKCMDTKGGSGVGWLGRWNWHIYTSLVAQRVKRLPAMQQTWVQSLGWKDPLEKEMETHSSILAWRIPWTEKPGRLQSMGSQRVRHDWVTSLTHSHIKQVTSEN